MEVVIRMQAPNACCIISQHKHPRPKPSCALLCAQLANIGSLRALLDSHGDLLLPRPDVQLRLASQIADGMAYLHGRDPPILHHDLKSLNILCFSKSERSKLQELSVGTLDELSVKICDFGLATGLGSSAATMLQSTKRAGGGAIGGTLAYCAPEYFEGAYTENSEVYSYGIIVSELLTAKVPWSTPDPLTGRPYSLVSLQLAVSRGVRPELPNGSESHLLAQLARECWQNEATRRPSFKQIARLLLGTHEPSSDATVGMVVETANTAAGTSASHAKMHHTLGGRNDRFLCSHKDYTEAAGLKSFGPSTLRKVGQSAEEAGGGSCSSDDESSNAQAGGRSCADEAYSAGADGADGTSSAAHKKLMYTLRHDVHRSHRADGYNDALKSFGPTARVRRLASVQDPSCSLLLDPTAPAASQASGAVSQSSPLDPFRSASGTSALEDEAQEPEESVLPPPAVLPQPKASDDKGCADSASPGTFTQLFVENKAPRACPPPRLASESSRARNSPAAKEKLAYV